MEKFTFFWGGPFSQWHKSAFRLEVPIGNTRGILEFNCAEQYMMYMKAATFGDWVTAEAIIKSQNPKEQKGLGRKVKPFDAVVWNAAARGIVYDGNMAKFTQNQQLKRQLLTTEGTTLVEASPVDTIWGIGLPATDPRANYRATWRGKNWLGETLTAVRNKILVGVMK